MIERLTKRNSNGDVASHVDPRKRHMLFVNRLAAYEDSGLSPEEVQKMARAKAEGRLVVLPCKVGNTVYRIISYKCNAVCNKLNACNSFIYKGCKQAEFYVCPGTFQFNDIEWIGKTVFLTREEAEKAIGGKQDV